MACLFYCPCLCRKMPGNGWIPELHKAAEGSDLRNPSVILTIPVQLFFSIPFFGRNGMVSMPGMVRKQTMMKNVR